MDDIYLKFYFYKILVNNLEEDKNKFFYVAKNIRDKKILSKRLIHILIYYKSFVDYERTIKYIDYLKKLNLQFLEDILSYIVNTPYCRILKYLSFCDKPANIEDIKNIDFYFTEEILHKYENVYYSDKELEKGIKDKFTIQNEKYQIDNELITDEYLKYKEKYLSHTLYRSMVF